MRDENDELPDNFLHELYKWALECRLTFMLCCLFNSKQIYILVFLFFFIFQLWVEFLWTLDWVAWSPRAMKIHKRL